MEKIDKAGLLKVLESMPYAVDGFAVVKPHEEMEVLWKRRPQDKMPWFAVNGLDPKLFSFTNAEGEKWCVWADLDEFGVTSSAWDWEMRVLAPVDYLKVLETMNMSRVFLGHAFRYEEKSWLILVATIMVKRSRIRNSFGSKVAITSS